MFAWIGGILTALPMFFTYKVLAGLGIALVTVTGWTFAVNTAFTLLANHIGGMSANILALLNIMGLPSALGIISGAIVSAFALRTISTISLGAVS